MSHAQMTAIAAAAAAPAGWLAARIADGYAQARSPARYGLAILTAAAGFLWAALVAPSPGVLALSLGLGVGLLTLAMIDLACLRLPDRFTLPLALAGLAASGLLPEAPVTDHLAGAVGGWAVLAGLALAYERVRGREGIGLGDAKLLGAAGAWLGWRPLPSVILIACGLALVWAAIGMAARRQTAPDGRLAFGPPLCVAVWIVWLQGPLSV